MHRGVVGTTYLASFHLFHGNICKYRSGLVSPLLKPVALIAPWVSVIPSTGAKLCVVKCTGEPGPDTGGCEPRFVINCGLSGMALYHLESSVISQMYIKIMTHV